MPKSVWLAFLAALAGAAALILSDEPLQVPGVSAANVARIKPGMSMDEVEAILGRRGDACFGVGGFRAWHTWYHWSGITGLASVTFRGDSRRPREVVERATFTRADPNLVLDLLRARLGFPPTK